MKDKNEIEKHINNYMNGVYTQDEALKVLDIIKKNEPNESLEKCMTEAWTESENLAPVVADDRQLKGEAHALLHKETRKYIILSRKKLHRAIWAAASVVIVVSLSVIGYDHFSTPTESKQLYAEQSTLYGETKDIVLPDGTMVTLNSCSSISYPEKFDGDERLIKLRGEAFFQVKKNEKQPFIINTSRFNVKVLGTEFNIKAYDGDIMQSINVEGGKVQVDLPEAMVRLVASEQMDINTKTEEYAKYKGQPQVAVWRNGSLRFNKTPIKDVTNELERIYEVKIAYEKGTTFNNLITGEHSNSSLSSVLKSLTSTSNIRFKYDEDKAEVYIYR